MNVNYLMRYILLIAVLFGMTCIPCRSQEIGLADIPFKGEIDAYKWPFIGGIRSPQFNTADLNLDGLEDVVIFEKTGSIITPLIRQEDGSFSFEPSYRSIFPIPPHWFLMRDYNNDGIKDIFCSPINVGIPGLEVYKGVVTEGVLSYELVVFPEKDFDILYVPIGSTVTQIYASVIDLPDIKDLDNDGDLDIIAFEPSGRTIYHYRNQSVELGYGTDTLIYELEASCYGGLVESSFSEDVSLSPTPGDCASSFQSGDELVASSRHSGSTILSMDVSGDSLHEMFLGDISFDGLVELTNGGTLEEAHFVEQNPFFPTIESPVDIDLFVAGFDEDVDGDGNRELVVTSNDAFSQQTGDHVWLYEVERTEGERARFELITKNFVAEDMIYHGPNSTPMFFDHNGDGLTDLLIGSCGRSLDGSSNNPALFLYENIGTSTEPSYKLRDEDYQGMSEFNTTTLHFSPAIGDIDGDGDQDMVVGDNAGWMYFLENESGDKDILEFSRPVYRAFNIKVSAWAKPEIYDYNGDGLGDLIMGELNFNSSEGKRGSFTYFENQGTVGDALFNANESMAPNDPLFGRIDLKEPTSFNNYSAPAMFDIGDELILATGTSDGFINIYQTNEEMPEDSFQLRSFHFGDILEGEQSKIDLADLDNDGFLEMAVGTRRGGIAIFTTDIKIDLGSANVQVSESEDINIYPNPVSQNMTIDMDLEELRKASVSIYNVQGQLINIYQNVTSNLDVSHLETGIYFLELRTAKESYTHRFVKISN